MTDFILFLHVLSAFMLAATVVIAGAAAFGATVPDRTMWVSDRLWDVGGIGTLVFGIWLAVDIERYEIWDTWIIAALVLWVLASGAATRARAQRVPWHWVQSGLVLLLLIDMVWKPGA